MERPRTKIEDYYKFRAERDAIERNMVSKRLAGSDPEVENAMREIKEKFEGQIHKSDNFEFRSPEEMKQFLLEHGGVHGLTETEVDEMIKHELEHAEIAKKQGHEFTLGIWILDAGDGKIGWAPYCRVSFDRIITEDERREIAQAPDNKSELDV